LDAAATLAADGQRIETDAALGERPPAQEEGPREEAGCRGRRRPQAQV